MHLLSYNESAHKAPLRPRHPLICLFDGLGLGLMTFFFSQADSFGLKAFLAAMMLMYTLSFIHHWIRNTLWGRLFDHIGIFTAIAMTGFPFWGEHVWGLILTAVIIVGGAGFKYQTFICGGNSFTKRANALMYVLATVPVTGYVLWSWSAIGWPWNTLWMLGCALHGLQLAIYTKHLFNWKPELFGYREVQHLVLPLAITAHYVVYSNI